MKRRAASEPAASAEADVTDIDQESSAAAATASLLENLREKQQAKRQKRQRRRWDFRTVAFFEQRSSSSSSEFDDDEQDNSANVDDHCMQIGYGRAPAAAEAAAGNSQQNNNNNNKGDSGGGGGGGGGGGSGNDHSEAEMNASNPEAGDDQADDDGSATAPQLYEEKQHYVHRLERFALQRHVTEFVLNGQHERPDEALRDAFERIIKRAIRNAEQQQQDEQQSGNQDEMPQDGGGGGGGAAQQNPRRRVTKIGIFLDGNGTSFLFVCWQMSQSNIIHHIGLTDPIVLPIRPPEQNTADTLMGELEKLGQSDGDEDVHGGGMIKRSLLLSEPVQIVVTCIAPPVGAAPRFHHYQHWGYNERQLIRIRNVGDHFCLFHALIAARSYTDHDLTKMVATQQKQCQQGDVSNSDHLISVPSAAATAVMRRPDFCANHEVLNRLLSSPGRMQEAVRGLMLHAGIDPDGQAYGVEHVPHVQHHWDRLYPGMYRIVLFEDRPEELPRPIWKGPMGRCFVVALFMSGGHFDAIKKVNCFFKLGRKYCIDCECVYTADAKHTISCKSRCAQCTRVGPQQPCEREAGVSIHCSQCNRFFFSRICFDAHRRGQACNLLKRCTKCSRTFQNDPKNPHQCYTSFCGRCNVYHEKDAACFIKKIPVPKQKPNYRILCWDTETRLEHLQEAGHQRHKVNHLSVNITCTECCDSATGECVECAICTTEEGILCRKRDWSEANGDEPLRDFVEWVLRAWSNKHKTYLWAHNSSRFDGHFVLKYLGETSRRPDVVMNGLKIYEFRLQHSRQHSMLIWRDSCLLMPVRLDQLPKTFNLDCAEKPFFPYAFNRRENYGVRLPHLPPIEDYCAGSMKREKYDKFVSWYEENKTTTPFFLPDELQSYCQNDTEILLKAIVQFRKILMRDITGGYDVLPISCTIASICMSMFRAQFLCENQLAIVPERGYERNDRASVFAIKYLDWRAKTDAVKIQHAGNGMEKRWRQFKLDGWIEEQNRCIEVLGCYWHGCERCFDPGDKLVDAKSCRELNEETNLRLMQLRQGDMDGQGLQVEAVWECEINAQLANNAEMRAFFSDLGMDRGPIDPRGAYFGGRTGPLKLFAEPKEDEKISVFDIISLYPFVNYTCEYPVGIPTIIRPMADEMCVNWTRPEQLPYRGILRVRVVPPRGLRVPVLPVKIDERLLFCCCHHCATMFRKKSTRRPHKCSHTDAQRSFTGSYTHIELERALEHGYKIDRLWRAWHYDEWSDQIFKDYVRLLIKLKIESSGFPEGVSSVVQKQRYADEYRRIYEVEIELENVKKNPGLRFIAKLMLNSLWGKFSMRNELGANKVITRPQEFFSLLFDHKIELSAIVPFSDQALRVLYKPKKNFVSEHTTSNIVISLWTTSCARLKLHDYMVQVDQREDSDLLYTDTDSVVVLHKRDTTPLETGEFLGQMSEEYLDYDIKTFICGGAKQYAFRMRHKRTNELEFVQKIRGITFDVNNSKALQFDNFVEKVLNYGRVDNKTTTTTTTTTIVLFRPLFSPIKR
ncbi:hypothetical protein niasHS_008166 [Heterodera schachtii]|uniref:DNA-directed DNA polymerase n=1 Tax=Heterodera schachtii TaxID=97005 RepID=A0ABD2J1K4_HETSC